MQPRRRSAPRAPALISQAAHGAAGRLHTPPLIVLDSCAVSCSWFLRKCPDMITPAEVRAGMERGELCVEYQPIILLAEGRCVGAEALVRWRRGRDVLSAIEFMPQVENTPLSGTITYWVIDTIAAELGVWLDEHPDAHISLNVPPEILGRGGLEYAALRSGLRARANQIVLEITERGVPDRLGLDALNAMAERGIRVALDDTMLNGTNLALLARCHFSAIKLDRELTLQVREDRPLPSWLAGLTALMASSALQVVAEGIESEFQSRTLAAAGVQMGQGYLYATSLTSKEFMRFWS
jgi:sensor c-di-GMP phosphodiesterase-like protein